MIKVGAAMLVFAIWHSFLCADGTKNRARALFGARRGTAFYRAFFMLQALFASGALFYYVWKQPNRIIYQARGARKLLCWAIQAASLAVFGMSMFQFDKPKFLGVRGALDFKNGEPISEAQAQGPELDAEGAVRVEGVFRYSRHPLEWALAIVFLASPTMKTNWLIFDVLNAIYSFVGALHEEKRLGHQSKNYAAYQKQVAFFFGKPKF